MREQDRLRGLEMRRSGHDRLAVVVCEADESALHPEDRRVEVVDRSAEP